MHDFHAQKVLRDYLVLPERLYINSNKVDNQNLNLLLFAFMLEWLYYYLTIQFKTILFYNVIKRWHSFNYTLSNKRFKSPIYFANLTNSMFFWSSNFFKMVWTSCGSCYKNRFFKFSNVSWKTFLSFWNLSWNNCLSSWWSYSSLSFFSNKSSVFRTSPIIGPTTAHFKSVASFLKVPIAPPSILTSLLFCWWAWSIASLENILL